MAFNERVYDYYYYIVNNGRMWNVDNLLLGGLLILCDINFITLWRFKQFKIMLLEIIHR